MSKLKGSSNDQNKNHTKKITNPHDRFFRGAMSDPEVALAFIKRHLPSEIIGKMELSSLQLMPGSFIEEDFSESLTDVLYKVSVDGKPGYIYTLIEHQRNPDSSMPLRILEYSCAIFRAHMKATDSIKLPLIYPVVLFNGRKNHSQITNLYEMFEDPEMARLTFPHSFQFIDLNQIDDEELQKSALLGIIEIFLKHAYTRDIISLIQKKTARALEELLARNKSELFKLLIHYLFYTQTGEYSKQELVDLLRSHLTLPAHMKIKTIADSLIEEGMEQGLTQGRQEGRQEGRRAERQHFQSLFTKQLKSRFPKELTSHYLGLIEKAESDQLFYWIERLSTAASIKEVFNCF